MMKDLLKRFAMIKRFQAFCEQQAFGVCTRLGQTTGVSSSSIRLFFIYASFLTLGSPVIVYLSMAFVMNLRKHNRRFYRTLFEA